MMTEAVAIALISNLTTIVIVVFCRLWSNREHRQGQVTANRVEDKVDALTNGKTS
jgi:hypothetical protein